MATLYKKGELFVVAGTILSFTANDFVDENGDIPHTISVNTSGTFTNCSSNDTLSIKADETQSDTTCAFEVNWTSQTDPGTTITSEVTAKVLGALPSHNISTTLVGNTIGCTCRNISDLCKASTINPYSYYKPDGNSPYKLGDFRWYCHTQPGGALLKGNPASASSTDNEDNTHNPVTVGAIASKNGQTLALIGTSYSHFKILLYIAGILRSSQIYDLSSNDYASLSYTTNQYQGQTEFKIQMSADGSTWVDAPASQTITGTITFNPALISWWAEASGWTNDNGLTSATIEVENTSQQGQPDSSYEYQTEIISKTTGHSEQDTFSDWTDLTTLSPGESYTGDVTIGLILPNYEEYQVRIHLRRVNVPASERLIGSHTFI